MCGGCDRRPEEDGMGVDYEAEDWEEQAEQAKRVYLLSDVSNTLRLGFKV